MSETEPNPSEEPTAGTHSENSEFMFNIPVFGKVARIVWDGPTMTRKEWEKLKKVGDAMFLDDSEGGEGE